MSRCREPGPAEPERKRFEGEVLNTATLKAAMAGHLSGGAASTATVCGTFRDPAQCAARDLRSDLAREIAERDNSHQSHALCKSRARAGLQTLSSALRKHVTRLSQSLGCAHGTVYSYQDVFLDLDPTYKDRLGRPLVRITLDCHDNELQQNRFLTDKFAEIFRAMGAQQVVKEYRTGPYDITKYQTTHLCGGAIMGTDPGTSALNRYLQSWDVPNLFVMAPAPFPRTPAITRPGRSPPSRTGQRRRSARSI